jgi:hypothetical protein
MPRKAAACRHLHNVAHFNDVGLRINRCRDTLPVLGDLVPMANGFKGA